MHQGKPVAVCREICGWQQVYFFVRKVKKSETRTPWAGEVIECAGGLLGLPVFLRYGNRIGEGGFWGSFFGRSASWRRLVIPIYFMYGNRMTMGNRNEVKI